MRLLIVGPLGGQISAATKIAMMVLFMSMVLTGAEEARWEPAVSTWR